MKPESGFENPTNIIAELAEMNDRDIQDGKLKHQQRLFAYCNILKILGFSGPNDESSVLIYDLSSRDELDKELAGLDKLKYRNRSKRIHDTLKKIQGILVDAWGISPKLEEGSTDTIRLVRTPTSLCFPGYSYERYESYKTFMRELYSNESVLHDDDDKFDENALIFASEDSLSKRQRTS